MNTEEIKAEAKRRLDAMDPQELSRRVAKMGEMSAFVGQSSTKYLMPRKYGKLTSEETTRYQTWSRQLSSIRSRRDPDQRATDVQLRERFGLSRDDMRDGDPKRLRPQLRSAFWRWFQFFLLLILSVVLADVLGLSGGRYGWIAYVFAMSFFGLTLNFFVRYMLDLVLARKYTRSIPKVSSPAYQEQEVQAELDYMILQMAEADRE